MLNYNNQQKVHNRMKKILSKIYCSNKKNQKQNVKTKVKMICQNLKYNDQKTKIKNILPKYLNYFAKCFKRIERMTNY